jgi:hypothetical protein
VAGLRNLSASSCQELVTVVCCDDDEEDVSETAALLCKCSCTLYLPLDQCCTKAAEDCSDNTTTISSDVVTMLSLLFVAVGLLGFVLSSIEE